MAERKNVYARSADRLRSQADAAEAEAKKATKIWSLVAELSREDLYILEQLLQDELHGSEDE